MLSSREGKRGGGNLEPKRERRKSKPLPALPTNKKNQTLPVRFTTSGTAYLGLRKRSTTVHIPPSILTLAHQIPHFILSPGFGPREGSRAFNEFREEWEGGLKSIAARRMKGVVRPQARPTRRKERM